MDKHSSLLGLDISDQGKMFYDIDTSGMYYKCFTIVIYNHNDSGQYYKTRITIVFDDPSLSQCRSQPQLVSSITIVSDATIWSVTYDCHCDDRNGFIIQATDVSE